MNAAMMELKPCLYCGAKGQNVFRIFAKIEDDGEVICDDGEKQRAINAWNRRADDVGD